MNAAVDIAKPTRAVELSSASRTKLQTNAVMDRKPICMLCCKNLLAHFTLLGLPSREVSSFQRRIHGDIRVPTFVPSPWSLADSIIPLFTVIQRAPLAAQEGPSAVGPEARGRESKINIKQTYKDFQKHDNSLSSAITRTTAHPKVNLASLVRGLRGPPSADCSSAFTSTTMSPPAAESSYT